MRENCFDCLRCLLRVTYLALITCALLPWIASSPASASALGAEETPSIKLGIIAPRGPLKSKRRYQPLCEYFQTVTGLRCRLIPLDHARNLPFIRDGKVDFLLTNPTLSATIQEALGIEMLANVEKMSGSRFGGVIFTRKSAGIRSVNDIKDKRILAYRIRRSAGGHIFQSYHLYRNGLDDRTDSRWLRGAKTQDDVVIGVLNGIADVGFVRTGILEYMAREGRIKMDDFHIIDQARNSDYPEVHSTDLYPEWYLMAGKHVNADLKQRIKHAALTLSAEHPAAKATEITGFVEPYPLGPLINVLKTLKIPPFDH